MQHNDFLKDDDDALWDDLDESDFEQCILKETEFLTQNPSAQRKDSRNNHSTKEEASLNHWVDGRSNSFNNDLPKPLPKSKTKNGTNEKLSFKGKSNTFENSSFFLNNSFPHTSRKQNFYKPLDIGPSSEISNVSVKRVQVTRKCDIEAEDTEQSLQSQLDIVLKEKAKLEEENLIKHGEVLNVRCELKRKDAALEAERIDHCLALEAAEKRGQEKASKMLTDANIKVKILEKEVDRLQGNLLFKSREAEELLLRYKSFECQPSLYSNTQNTNVAGDCSSKRRRLEFKASPTKAVSNFANRFDFGDMKRSVKNALTQTEFGSKAKTRTAIQVHSPRGRSSGSKELYHHLSSPHQVIGTVPPSEIDPVEQGLNLLAQLIYPENSLMTSTGSQDELVKAAHTLLQCLVTEVIVKGNSSLDGRCESRKGKVYDRKNGIGSAIPSLSILALAQSASPKMHQDSLRILSHCLLAFLRAKASHITEILLSLESLAVLARVCSNLHQEACDAVVLSFKECCKTPSNRVIFKFIVVLILFIKFESFRRNICTSKSDECLLRKICNLFQCTGKQLRPKEITNQMIAFVACLLHDTDLLVTGRHCDCSSLLLSTFIGHLLHTVELVAEDAHWHSVISGVKVLHLWQCKDRAWWEKALQLHTYTALLSSVVRKSKYLKARGILDQHSWELLFDLYDVEDPAL